MNKNQLFSLASAVILAATVSCTKDSNTDTLSNNGASAKAQASTKAFTPPTLPLYFRTGFKGPTLFNPSNITTDFSGTDSETNYKFDNSSPFGIERKSSLNRFIIVYNNSVTADREAFLTGDPLVAGSTNTTLRFTLNDAKEADSGLPSGFKGRVQAEISSGTQPGVKEYYQKVRVLLGAGFQRLMDSGQPNAGGFLTLFEFFNNPAPKLFRISVNLVKKVPGTGGALYLESQAQKRTSTTGGYTSDTFGNKRAPFPIPINQWVTLEIYIKENTAFNSNDGIFWLRMTPSRTVTLDGVTLTKDVPREAYYYKGRTSFNENIALNGFEGISTFKLYASKDVISKFDRNNPSTQMRAYFDDFEIRTP